MATSGKFYFENDPYFYPILNLDDDELQRKVEKLLEGYRLPIEKLTKLRQLLNEELQLGLEANPARKSAFPMFNTFVSKFPTGTEVGDFLGLDIGGTNLRIVQLTLSKESDGKYCRKLNTENYNVPAEHRLGVAKKFFDFLATCIGEYVAKHLPTRTTANPIPLGFTFSFGFDQLAINQGRIVQFGIATNLTDGIGKDPALLMQQSIDAKQIPVKLVTLSNDSTTVLVYGKHLVPATTISFIFGSGSNVAYVEKVANYKKISDPVSVFGYKVDQFIVNSECVLYGENGELDFITTRYDTELDANSLIPKSYVYEKLIGGAFMGELFRYTLLDCIRRGLILQGKFTKPIVSKHSIATSDMSDIDADIIAANSGNVTSKLLTKLGYSKFSDDDRRIVEHICQLITVRSGLFSAALMAPFVDQVDAIDVQIACDGSVFKKHPKMNRLINSFLRQMCPHKKPEAFLADNGSSIGSAMAAACYSRE